MTRVTCLLQDWYEEENSVGRTVNKRLRVCMISVFLLLCQLYLCACKDVGGHLFPRFTPNPYL